MLKKVLSSGWFQNGAERVKKFFDLPYPQVSSSKDATNRNSVEIKKLMEAFSIVYGIRDVFMGASILAAALCGTRQALGWIMVAAARVAATDGAAPPFLRIAFGVLYPLAVIGTVDESFGGC